MRLRVNINNDWKIVDDKGNISVSFPFSWEERKVVTFRREFDKLSLLKDGHLYIEFRGVSSSCQVILNGNSVGTHSGGYSTFRFDLTDCLEEKNILEIVVDNKKNDRIYPQKADFTFFGGIYRDVSFLVVDKEHFDLDYYGSKGIKIDTSVNNKQGTVVVHAYTKSQKKMVVHILDKERNEILCLDNGERGKIENVHLWKGREDPYLYMAVAQLVDDDGTILDEVSSRFGFRTFSIDSHKGFMLNGMPYPLHGVSRHQDRARKGYALTKEDQEEDIRLIKEVGANAVRLAHYQQDDYFYDLCDENGIIVWTESPYISEHLDHGDDNAIQQMRELICQQYNHPSIVVWGLSNEITMFRKNRKEMLSLHRRLNDMVHSMDPLRKTTLACFAACSPFDKVAHITDVVGWNLYLGWYTPFFFLNDVWIAVFHLLFPKRPLAYSEYGAEGMPNLHSHRPKRFDNSEEYQCLYHEKLLWCFERHPWLWATFVWNMFDFSSEGRNQGGEPGMNHKGLVTYDRKTKKDAFYLYKAWWTKEDFVHLCGKRYVYRHERRTEIKVYTTCDEVTLFLDGKRKKAKKGKRIFRFHVFLHKGENHIKVRSGKSMDEMTIIKVDRPYQSYKLIGGNSRSWEKK